MSTMSKRILAFLLLIIVMTPLLAGCMGDDGVDNNEIPVVEILYPRGRTAFSGIVMISGIASDKDGNDTLMNVEVKIDEGEWVTVDGTTNWSYDWRGYNITDGSYSVYARAWDGTSYSDIDEINLLVDNPDIRDSYAHKWAVFVAAANYPEKNESKLGNGGLYLAENITSYLIENCGYPTSNIIILFDDGWIRTDNGYGTKTQPLQERIHKYDIVYGGATKANTEATIKYIIDQSNQYSDSEIFIWVFGHGYGNQGNPITGGKILEKSAFFLWDDTVTDSEFGDLLSGLKSKKACIIVDACYSGGFADKTILNLPTLFLLHSNIPKPGRIVMTGASKFRVGWTSPTAGPLFSMIWFEGLTTGNADGFRPGISKIGRRTWLRFFKDGKVSVEEAFYYARYMLRARKVYDDYQKMEPQINDQYPNRGVIRSLGGMFL
jgi:hypothetical protein